MTATGEFGRDGGGKMNEQKKGKKKKRKVKH